MTAITRSNSIIVKPREKVLFIGFVGFEGHHSDVSLAMKAKMQWRGRLLDKTFPSLCM